MDQKKEKKGHQVVEHENTHKDYFKGTYQEPVTEKHKIPKTIGSTHAKHHEHSKTHGGHGGHHKK